MSFTKQKISYLNLIIKNDIGHALGKPHRHLFFFLFQPEETRARTLSCFEPENICTKLTIVLVMSEPVKSKTRSA